MRTVPQIPSQIYDPVSVALAHLQEGISLCRHKSDELFFGPLKYVKSYIDNAKYF